MSQFEGRIVRQTLPNGLPLLWLPQAEPAAAVILLPRFGQTKEACLWQAADWHAQGFAVAVPELADHGARIRADLPVALRRDFFATYLELSFRSACELPALIDWLLETGCSRVVLVGAGLGGATALVAAGLDDRLDAVVAESAIADYDSFMAGSVLPAFLTGRPAEAFLEPETRRRFRAHDPAVHPERYAPTPLLLLHGEEDDLHPLAGVRTFWERLIAPYEDQGAPLVLRTEPEVGHEGHRDWFELAVAWAQPREARAIVAPVTLRKLPAVRRGKLPLLRSAKQVY